MREPKRSQQRCASLLLAAPINAPLASQTTDIQEDKRTHL